MKKLLITTSVLAVAIVTSQAQAATSSYQVSSLEKRLAKLEKKVSKKSSVFSDTKVFGRIQYDKAIEFNGDETEKFNISRLVARIGTKGKLSGNWGYKIEAFFSEGNESNNLGNYFATDDEDNEDNKIETVGINNIIDGYLYKKFGDSTLTFGQYKEAISLQNLTSSNDVIFINRSKSLSNLPRRSLGIKYDFNIDNFGFAINVNGASANNPQGLQFVNDVTINEENSNYNTSSEELEKNSEDERVSSIIRTYFTPISDDNILVHIGLSYGIEDPKYLPNKITTTASDSTGAPTTSINFSNDLKQITRSGLELSVNLASLNFQGEYLNEEYKWKSETGVKSKTNQFSYYLQTSILITGESRSYKDGIFTGVKPNSPLGAVEVAYRHSKVNDHNLGNKIGFIEQNEFAINYYANKNVKFAVNYIHDASKYSNVKTPNANDTVSADTLLLRAQVKF